MQFSNLAVFSFVSVATISAHPFSVEGRYSNAAGANPRADIAPSTQDLAARDAVPFNMDDIRQGAHNTIDHVRHKTHNQTIAVTEQAHKYTPAAKEYEPGVEMGVCAAGAFIPGVDLVIDTACLGLAAAKGGHALYKHAHNHTHSAKHPEASHKVESSHHIESSQHLEPSRYSDTGQLPHPTPTPHSDPPQHSGAAQHSDSPQHSDSTQNSDSAQHTDTPQHSEALQHKRDRYIRHMRDYWNFP